MVDRQTKEKKNQNLKTSLIIFGILLFLVLGFLFYMKNMMPNHLMSQGKKYYELGDYEKALKMFNMAADANPYDDEPVYYKALTLSKLEPTYENQKALYEIAQLEDCEEASNIAEEILLNMRKAMDKSIGPNYADNVLYEDILIRWNNAEPIKYHISSHMSIPEDYTKVVKQAFANWQNATDGVIKFQEVQNPKMAQISITFVEHLDQKYTKNNPNLAAVVTPVIEDVKLEKMDIEMKRVDAYSREYTNDKLLSLAQHQIGHALGLWGHSANENDVMYYSGDVVDHTTVAKKLSNRDINTVLLLYKMIPDVIDKPIPPEAYSDMFYHSVLTTYPGENFELEIQRLISQLKDDRQNIIIWVDLAINYAYKKQYPRSNYILNKVLPLVSSDFRNQHVILYNLAANFYKMEEYEMAEKYLNYAVKIEDDLETQILESFIDLKLGRESIARDKLELLNRTHPDHIEIALKLAEVYNKNREQGRAKEVIEKLVKENPRAMNDRRVMKYKNVKREFLGS